MANRRLKSVLGNLPVERLSELAKYSEDEKMGAFEWLKKHGTPLLRDAINAEREEVLDAGHV